MNVVNFQDIKLTLGSPWYTYTLTFRNQKDNKETFPFTIVMKIIAQKGVNLLKEIKDLYIENYKTLMEKIKEDTNRWINIPCSWIRRINIVKMSIEVRDIVQEMDQDHPHGK